MSSARAALALLIGAAYLGCAPATQIDVCARGDRDELRSALAGGHLAISYLDANGATIGTTTTVSIDASSHLPAAAPAGAVRVQVDGLGPSGTVVAGGSAPLNGLGACVCLALSGQRVGACGSVSCTVADGQCQFAWPGGDPDAVTRTLVFGENASDDVHGVTADTDIEQYMPTLDYGGNPTFRVKADTTSSVGLLRFDLSELPRASVIEQAALTLQVGADATNYEVGVYRVLEPWSEGTHDGHAEGCASWTCRSDGAAWTVPGCGYTSEAVRSRERDPLVSFRPSVPGMQYAFDVTAAVAGWVATPASNFGLTLVGTGTNDGVDLVSHEAIAPGAVRPRLSIQYHLP